MVSKRGMNAFLILIVTLSLFSIGFVSAMQCAGTPFSNVYEYDSYRTIDKAFDGRVDNSQYDDEWLTNDDSVRGPAAIGYDFKGPVLVTEYTITSVSYSNNGLYYNPKSFRFEGSNDLRSWTVLDSRTGVGWGGYNAERKTFTIASPNSYRYYQLVITEAAHSPTYGYKGLSELEMNISGGCPDSNLIVKKFFTNSSNAFTTLPSYDNARGFDKAFDDRVDSSVSNDEWMSGSSDPTKNLATIGYDFKAPVLVTEYAITSTSYSNNAYWYNPKVWTFQGSNDMSSWTVLDSRDIGWSVYSKEKKYFPIAADKQGSYRFYKLVITETVHSTTYDYKSLSELEFYGSGILPDSNLIAKKLITNPSNAFTTLPAYDSYRGAEKAFDGRVISSEYNDEWMSDNSDATTKIASIGYDFQTKTLVTEYTITSVSYSNNGHWYNPKVWTFQGSNDMSSWTVLDSRSNIGWDSYGPERKSFPIAADKQGSYRYYKLAITEATGSPTYPYKSLSELEFYQGIPLSISFVAPTPTNNSNIADAVTINVSSSKSVSSCTLTMNGVDYSMNIKGSSAYSINSGLSEGVYNYFVTCDGVKTETRMVKAILANITQAIWADLNGKEITQIDKNDYVLLKVSGKSLENQNINYTVYKSNLFWFDKSIATVSSSLGYLSLEINQSGEYYYSAKLPNGNVLTSKKLQVLNSINNEPTKISIVSPACGANYTLNETINFIVNISDSDDFVSGYFNSDGQRVEINNLQQIGSVVLNKSGNIHIVANVTDRDGKYSRTISNIMVIDSTKNGIYLAACITSPRDTSNIGGGNVTFDASKSKGINYTLSQGQVNMPISSLYFNWTFYQLVGLSTSYSGNYNQIGASNFDYSFPAGTYTALLEISK